MKIIHKPWILEGYKTFAIEGVEKLKIERISKSVGKNKSSFYHHFSDLEVFIDILVDYHLERTYLIAKKESKSTSLEELIEILVDHKIDLLFNRQLRIHRDNNKFKECFLKTNQITEEAVTKIWSEIIDIKHNSYLAKLVLRLSLENFFLQLTDQTLNRIWLKDYFINLRNLVRAVKKSGDVISLDGTV